MSPGRPAGERDRRGVRLVRPGGGPRAARPRPRPARRAGGADPADSGPGPDLLLWGLAVVILCYVWRFQDLLRPLGAFEVPMLAAGLTLFLFALDTDARRRLGDLDGRVLRLLAGLFAVMILSVPFGLWQTNSALFLLKEFLPYAVLLTVIGAAAVRGEEDLRWLAGIHVVGVVLFSLVVLVRFDVGMGGRLGGLAYYDANDLGALIVATFPMALFYLLRGRSFRTKALAATGMLIMLMTLVKTGSRGAFLGFLVVGAYILIRYRSIPSSWRITAVAGALLVVTVAGGGFFWERMQTLANPTEDYNWAGQSETGRMEVWKRGIGYLFDRPLTGVGVANYAVAEGTMSTLGQVNLLEGRGFKWSTAHNAYLQIAVETGFGGLILFLALLATMFRIGGRSPPLPPGPGRRDAEALRQGLRVAVVGYAVTAFFLSAAYYPILFALLGMFVAITKLDRWAVRAAPRAAAGRREGRRRAGPRDEGLRVVRPTPGP